MGSEEGYDMYMPNAITQGQFLAGPGQPFRLTFVSNHNGNNGHMNTWGLGINALPKDKRDGVSQWVMAHKWHSNKGVWKYNVLPGGLINIKFISSVHGGDAQFAEHGLGINALPKDKRDGGSQWL